MPFPSMEQVIESVRRLNYDDKGDEIHTCGLWHILIFLRHRRLHGMQEEYTLYGDTLAVAAFDILGINFADNARDLAYYEPAATEKKPPEYFRVAGGVRNTITNRFQTGLSGLGPRQPNVVRISKATLPLDVKLHPDWIDNLRDPSRGRGNHVILDQRTRELITWLFRFGVPCVENSTSSLAVQQRKYTLQPQPNLRLQPLPTSSEELRALVEDFLGLQADQRSSLLPNL